MKRYGHGLRLVAMLACHESQVFEWLPHINDTPVRGDRLAWLKAWYCRRAAAVGRRFGNGLLAPGEVHAEAYELSEYGHQPSKAALAHQLGGRTRP